MSFATAPIADSLRGGNIAIGNFDGVHRGHRAMIEQLIERSRSHSRPAIIVTFDPHPLAFLRDTGAPPNLTTIPQRMELFAQLGIDSVVVLQTSRELLNLTAHEFFQQVVCEELGAAGMVEGPNFHFGKDRGGTIDLLRQFCREHGMSLDVIEPVTTDGRWVSSSVIRDLLQAGDLNTAVELLGHPYSLDGHVVAGMRRGRELGFPTANLSDIATVIPGPGVYSGTVEMSGRRYAAALNIGPNPTFEEGQYKVEAHIIDFQGDLYGQSLRVELQRRLRDIRRFASREDLQQQLRADIDTVVGNFRKSAAESSSA